MATRATHYDSRSLRRGLPRSLSRQADGLFVVGTLSHKMAPVLKRIYDKMCEPKWWWRLASVRAPAALRQLRDRAGPSTHDHSRRRVHPRVPARPESVIDGLMKARNKMPRATSGSSGPDRAAEEGRNPSGRTGDSRAAVRERLGAGVLDTHCVRGGSHGDIGTARPVTERWHSARRRGRSVRHADRSDGGDYLKYPGARGWPPLRRVYHLYSVDQHTAAPEGAVEQDDASVPTASGVWPIANWRAGGVATCTASASRGIPICAASSCTRSSVGHALRKDYPLTGASPDRTEGMMRVERAPGG